MTSRSNQEIKLLFERLPRTIVPTHYDVIIRPHLDTFKFNGDVTIHIQIKEPTDKVILYAIEIEVDHAKIKSNPNDEQQGKIDYDKEGERITVNFDKKLEKGDYQLLLKFVGEINNRMLGFYRTKYTVPDSDEVRYEASTQFDPADCRRAFPYWDEPNFKTTFDITLVTPKSLCAISNMPIKSENEYTDNKEWKVTRFERTPIMSTYLVAFVVGEYDYVETNDSSGVSMKVYTPVGKKEHGQFALDIAAKILPFYADYFNIKYPIAKADPIAIADFAMGAMENWAVDKCYPEFDIWTQFVADIFARFLVPDALKSSHPIEVPIGHPAEIIEIFDAISYAKGSSVIRMLHDCIGDDAFRQGLHNYLTENSYKNTVTENLWSHLAKASGKPVNEVMSSWTLQMGYPLLTVTEEHTDKKRVLQITQKRFIADGSIDEEKLQITHQVLMDKHEIIITLDNVSEDEWIKLNFNSIGLYRVKYESKTLARLSEPIANKTMSPQDRLMIQNDVAALLCNAGHQSFVDYLKLLLSHKDEDNFTVWKSIA
ncbi:unnamed protein product [Adineta steineri]|uniref:Uncharacterized protein n=1 Tax=Adineta steineri TaxID=433720 RepID=A0A815KEP4_9BILA|nr:unnamed protein product [Adineta steineri]